MPTLYEQFQKYLQEKKIEIPKLYETEAEPDPQVLLKFFIPNNSWCWFVTEYDGQDLFFGLVYGHEQELGYFRLSELAEIGFPIELDHDFEPKPLSQIEEEA